MSSITRHRFFPYLLLTAGTFFWSTNFVLGRLLASQIPPFTLCAGRFTVAAIFFAGTGVWYRWRMPQGRQWIYLFAMALTGVFLFNSLLYLALSYTTALNATLVNAFNPILTMLMAVIFLHEKASWRLWLGVLFSVVGVFYITVRGNLGLLLHLSFNHGDLLVLLGTLIWGLYSIVVKVATREIPVLQATAYANWIGVVMLYPVMFNEVQQRPFVLTGEIVWVFVYLGVFASVIAFICWNWSISKIGAVKATIFYNLIPLYAAVLSPLFLGEKLYLFHLIGGIFIIGGVVTGIGRVNQFDVVGRKSN